MTGIHINYNIIMQARSEDDFPSLGDNTLVESSVNPTWQAFHAKDSQQNRPVRTLVTVQQEDHYEKKEVVKQEKVDSDSDEEYGGKFQMIMDANAFMRHGNLMALQ